MANTTPSMLPRRKPADEGEEEEEDNDVPTTPWLQPLEHGHEDFSRPTSNAAGYNGKHLLDTNEGVWEEPARWATGGIVPLYVPLIIAFMVF